MKSLLSFTCGAILLAAKLTDQSALEPVTQERGQIARGAVLSNLIAHDNEEYGVITQYLRIERHRAAIDCECGGSWTRRELTLMPGVSRNGQVSEQVIILRPASL